MHPISSFFRSGKHPGKTNITDADNSLNILRYFNDYPVTVIVKHNNPCGVARGKTLAESYHKALMADRIAAFGGAVAVNKPLDMETAKLITESYLEVVVAPEFEEGTLELLAAKKNLRVMKIGNMSKLHDFVGEQFVDFKSLIDGGLVAQWSFVPRLKRKLFFLLKLFTGIKNTRFLESLHRRNWTICFSGGLSRAG